MIGSAVGGYIDPEKIKLPGIGDAQTQTASDGIPIAVVYGTPPPFQGNLIDGDPKARKIKVKTRQGKGGPIIISEKFLLTSAIGICEGEIEGVAWVVKDGQLVYDVRPNSQIVGESSKFGSKVVFYLGSEDQLPDPTLEAIHGVGNTPYYRGLAYMVIKDDDRTQSGGAVAQYSFGVVKNGTTTVVTNYDYLQPNLSTFKNAPFPLALSQNEYNYQATWINESGLGFVSPEYGSILEANLWFESTFGKVPGSVYIGYSANTTGSAGQYTNAEDPLGNPISGNFVDTQVDVIDIESLVLLYQWELPDMWYDQAASSMCLVSNSSTWSGSRNGCIVKKMTDYTGYLAFSPCDGGTTTLAGYYPYCIKVIRKFIDPDPPFGDPCDLEKIVRLPDAPDISVDCDADLTLTPFYSPLAFGYHVLANSEQTVVAGVSFYSQYTLGPVIPSDDARFDDEVFWTDAYDAAQLQGNVPSGWIFGVDYPVFGTEAFQSALTLTTIESGEISLEEIEEDLSDRCQVPVSHRDFTALAADIVPGYLVAIPASGADCIRPLQQLFFHDMPEFDLKIRAIKRGGSIVVTLTDDDFVQLGENEEDDDIRAQQTEYPKKLHLAYPDPDGNYAITKQTDPRYTPDILAVGEEVIPTPIPFDRDEAAKRISVMQKVAWTAQEGTMKRTLPEEFTYLVGSDCYLYNGKRFRIDSRQEADGQVAIDATYDRASAYTSVATGAAPLPPESPISSLRGPTTFAAMNLPSLRSEDNVPGIYVAMGNILDGWQGCQLMLSVDGGVSFNTVLTTNSPATLGHLTADIDAVVDSSGGPIPVRVHGELESITDAQISSRQNAFAIITNDVSEIGQFQTATDTGVNTYDLDNVTRGLLDTTAVEHFDHDRFVILDGNVHFLPLDVSLSGKILEFWPISIGTPPGNNVTYTVVFDPPVFIIDGGEVT